MAVIFSNSLGARSRYLGLTALCSEAEISVLTARVVLSS